MKHTGYALTLLCIASLCSPARGQHKYELGGVKFKDLEVVDKEGSGDPIKIDVSTIPQVGGAWTTAPIGERFQYGLECSFLLGFRFDKVNSAYLGGGGLYISISTSMWMFDLAGGPYASLFLDKNQNIRIYAAAGPSMTYVDYRSEAPALSFECMSAACSDSAFAERGRILISAVSAEVPSWSAPPHS